MALVSVALATIALTYELIATRPHSYKPPAPPLRPEGQRKYGPWVSLRALCPMASECALAVFNRAMGFIHQKRGGRNSIKGLQAFNKASGYAGSKKAMKMLQAFNRAMGFIHQKRGGRNSIKGLQAFNKASGYAGSKKAMKMLQAFNKASGYAGSKKAMKMLQAFNKASGYAGSKKAMKMLQAFNRAMGFIHQKRGGRNRIKGLQASNKASGYAGSKKAMKMLQASNRAMGFIHQKRGGRNRIKGLQASNKASGYAGNRNRSRSRRLREWMSQYPHLLSTVHIDEARAFRGVVYDTTRGKWCSRLTHEGMRIFLGYYDDPADAARAYDTKLVELKGTKAKTNFPLRDYLASTVPSGAAAAPLGAGPMDDTTGAVRGQQQQQQQQTSAFRGVDYDTTQGKWRSRLTHEGRRIFLGYYDDPADAARAYDTKLVELKGTKAKTNFPLRDYLASTVPSGAAAAPLGAGPMDDTTGAVRGQQQQQQQQQKAECSPPVFYIDCSPAEAAASGSQVHAGKRRRLDPDAHDSRGYSGIGAPTSAGSAADAAHAPRASAAPSGAAAAPLGAGPMDDTTGAVRGQQQQQQQAECSPPVIWIDCSPAAAAASGSQVQPVRDSD